MVAAAVIQGGAVLPVRFGYTVAGAVLLALALASERAVWQCAVTLTVGAFFLDVGRFVSENHPAVRPAITTVGALLLAVGVCLWVAMRQVAGREMISWSLRVLLGLAVVAAIGRAGPKGERQPTTGRIYSSGETRRPTSLLRLCAWVDRRRPKL